MNKMYTFGNQHIQVSSVRPVLSTQVSEIQQPAVYWNQPSLIRVRNRTDVRSNYCCGSYLMLCLIKSVKRLKLFSEANLILELRQLYILTELILPGLGDLSCLLYTCVWGFLHTAVSLVVIKLHRWLCPLVIRALLFNLQHSWGRGGAARCRRKKNTFCSLLIKHTQSLSLRLIQRACFWGIFLSCKTHTLKAYF